jgi:hypothetical protein
MIANPAISHPGTVPRHFTLNDLRLRRYTAEEPSSNSALTVSGLVLAAVLAIGAFVLLDPFALFAPAEVKLAAPESPSFVPSTEPARPAMKEIIIAPQPAVPATKSVEVAAAPAAAIVQAPRVPAPVARHRSSTVTPESRSNLANKTDTKVLQASPEVKAAPPAILIKPEEKMDAPIAPNRVDEVKEAPKPAATNNQPAVKEEAN